MRAAPLALVLLALVGCGRERSRPPDVRTPEPPQGERTITLDDVGLRFRAPVNWGELEAVPPLVGGVQSNSAMVAIWRYPRTEQLPESRGALRRAEERLIERVKQRDPTFALRSSELIEIDDARAIELLGRQTIAGLPFDVRSVHVFSDGTELVVDAYAPADLFERVDDAVFAPLVDSLALE